MYLTHRGAWCSSPISYVAHPDTPSKNSQKKRHGTAVHPSETAVPFGATTHSNLE